jgi:hypothetical protein
MEVSSDDPEQLRMLNILNPGIIVGGIQATESGDSLLNHCFDLSVISYVATDCEYLVTLASQLINGRTHCLLIPVG